jgi:CHAT domain-containing protein
MIPQSDDSSLAKKITTFRTELSENSILTMFFLFASPLLHKFSNQNGIHIMNQLNFKKEFEEIKDSIDDSKLQINYWSKVATIDNLPDIMIHNPFVIHFSGHGVKNNFETIGQNSVLRKDEGDMLLLEDSNCAGVLISEK